MSRTSAGYDAAVARVLDLQGRIERTLEYTDSLLRLPDLASDLTIVLRAVHNSLCTPANDPQCAVPPLAQNARQS